MQTQGRNRGGFTLIELSVVITILSLLFMAVLPSIRAQQDSRASVTFLSSLRRLALDARTRAIDRGETLTLTYNDGDRVLELRPPGEGNEEFGDPVVTVRMPGSAVLQNFQQGKNQSSSTNWQIRIFPDGTSDGGGFEVLDSDKTTYFRIDANALLSMGTGSLPDVSNERWEAGTLEQRLSSP